MNASADRQAQYAEIRERYLADPDFRAQLRADCAGTLTTILGPLTDEEQQWINDLPDASTSDEELVEMVRSGRLQAW
jgi:hypothetical protein